MCSRCAIVMTVQFPLKSRLTICWMCVSVTWSTLAVASSITRIGRRRSMALAIHRSCRSPEERLLPPSDMLASSPPDIASTFASSPDRRSASHSSASVCSVTGARLYRTVPWNRVGSCWMMERQLRSCCRERRRTSMPSMTMLPADSSTVRKRATAREDLPAPVRPTTPTRVRAGTENESASKTGVLAVGYLSRTSRKSMAPAEGHSFGGEGA